MGLSGHPKQSRTTARSLRSPKTVRFRPPRRRGRPRRQGHDSWTLTLTWPCRRPWLVDVAVSIAATGGDDKEQGQRRRLWHQASTTAMKTHKQRWRWQQVGRGLTMEKGWRRGRLRVELWWRRRCRRKLRLLRRRYQWRMLMVVKILMSTCMRAVGTRVNTTMADPHPRLDPLMQVECDGMMLAGGN